MGGGLKKFFEGRASWGKGWSIFGGDSGFLEIIVKFLFFTYFSFRFIKSFFNSGLFYL